MADFKYEYQIDKLVPAIKNFLSKEEVGTILDIGARDSVESIALAKSYPQATVFSFECNPATIPRCEDNIKKYGMEERVKLVKKAMTDKSGQISFFPINAEKTETDWKDGNPGASSLLEASGKYEIERYVQDKITVEATTIMDFVKEEEIEAIDIVWMDVQGAELKVLEGAGSFLEKIKFIHTETEFFEIYKNQAKFTDIYFYLRNKKFYLYWATDIGPFAGDMLFINSNMIPSSSSATMVIRGTFIFLYALTISSLKRFKYNLKK